MKRFWESKIGETMKEKCWENPQKGGEPDELWSLTITEVRDNKIQVSVKLQRLTPSGLITGEARRLGSHWFEIQPTLEEMFDEIIHAMAFLTMRR